MTSSFAIESLERDFKNQALLLVALASLLIATPFTVSNLLHGRLWLAACAVTVVAMFSYCAWRAHSSQEPPALLPYVSVPVIFTSVMICLASQGVAGFFWCFPAVLAFYLVLEERVAWLANGLLLLIVLPASFVVMEPALATRAGATLASVSLFAAISARTSNLYQATLKKRIVTDALTGLLNRSLLKLILSRAADQCASVGTPMTLLAIDLDHFKRINDTYGHDAGDRVLMDIGAIIKQNTRLADSSFRLGGEEFLCLLYGSDRENAMLVAYKLLNAIGACNAIANHQVTASIGVAEHQTGTTWEEWCKQADERLYAAKNAGRNCVR